MTAEKPAQAQRWRLAVESLSLNGTSHGHLDLRMSVGRIRRGPEAIQIIPENDFLQLLLS